MPKTSLIDRPLTTVTDEALGLDVYAAALVEFIRACETPVTIGIQGDWGIGKTSLLNLIDEQLPRNYPTLYINTWQFAQFEQQDKLPLLILRAVIDELKRSFDRKWTDKATEAAGWLVRGLGNALNQVTAARTGVDVKAAVADDGTGDDLPSMVVEYKDRFAELVSTLMPPGKGNVVIMIDDLDRVRPARALDLLEAIKVFLDVPQCVFLLAVDYSVIQRGVAEKLGVDTQQLHGKSFFDKIIQVPFNMPVASYRVDRYIMALLGWDWDEKRGYTKNTGQRLFLRIKDRSISAADVEFFTNITRLTVGSNPRSIKRAVNYANLLRIIVERQRRGDSRPFTKAEAKLLYPMAAFQLAWPELFAWFCRTPTPATIKKLENWDVLSSLPEAQPLFRRHANEEEVKSRITGFFDEFINLIDTNDDGDIQPREFAPVWKIMKEANLTSVALEDLDEAWSGYIRLARGHAPKSWPSGRLDRVMALFREGGSRWNSRVHFRLMPAGKRFYNMVWDGRLLGSIVSTRTDPVQVYLNATAADLEPHLPPASRPFVRPARPAHYGTGEALLCVFDIADSERPVARMNEVLDAMKALLGV